MCAHGASHVCERRLARESCRDVACGEGGFLSADHPRGINRRLNLFSLLNRVGGALAPRGAQRGGLCSIVMGETLIVWEPRGQAVFLGGALVLAGTPGCVLSP